MSSEQIQTILSYFKKEIECIKKELKIYENHDHFFNKCDICDGTSCYGCGMECECGEIVGACCYCPHCSECKKCCKCDCECFRDPLNKVHSNVFKENKDQEGIENDDLIKIINIIDDYFWYEDQFDYMKLHRYGCCEDYTIFGKCIKCNKDICADCSHGDFFLSILNSKCDNCYKFSKD